MQLVLHGERGRAPRGDADPTLATGTAGKKPAGNFSRVGRKRLVVLVSGRIFWRLVVGREGRGKMRMSARKSARFTVMLLAAGAAPAAGAVDLDPAPAVASSGANATTSISFPVFLDSTRFALMQASWRSRVSADTAVVVPVSAVAAEPEVETLNQARRTLSHGEEVSLKAIAVRARAEELSRRFAIDVSSESDAVVSDEAPVAAVAVEAPATDAVSIASQAAPVEAGAGETEISTDPVAAQTTTSVEQVSVQQVSLGTKRRADVAPASMLGGPRAEAEASVSEDAPVIENMATKPPQKAKRAVANAPARHVAAQAVKEPPTLFGIFSSWGSSEPEQVETTVAKSNDPDNNPMLPREIRSFGWNAQP